MNRREMLAFAPGFTAFLLLSWRFWFVTDDAFISWRYGRSLLNGHGLRFNVAEAVPVEGYTNFLWVLMSAIPEAFGVAPAGVMPVVSWVCGAVLLWRVVRLVRGPLEGSDRAAAAAGMLVGTTPVFDVWATGGLATMPFALLIFAVFEALVVEDRPGVAAALAAPLVLLRFEGVGWALVIGGLALGLREPRAVGRYLAVVGAVWAAYMAFRLGYHGVAVPNTVTAKVGFGLPVLVRGGRYLGMYLVTLGVPLLLLPAAWAGRGDRRLLAASALAVAVWVFSVVVGGDYMAFFRLLLPAVALQSVVIAVWLDTVPGTALLAAGLVLFQLLPAMGRPLAPQALRDTLSFRYTVGHSIHTELSAWQHDVRKRRELEKKGKALGAMLARSDSVVVPAVGNVGYHAWPIHVYDQNGLIDPTVARQAPATVASPGHDRHVDAGWFLGHRPTVVQIELLEPRKQAGRLPRLLRRWDRDPEFAAFRNDYGPDAVRAGRGTFLVVLRRVREGETADALYARAYAL